MKMVTEAEIDNNGPTMVVRYMSDSEADSLNVEITAETIQGGPHGVERCELVVIASNEPMTYAELKARVEVEAEARSIDCVAWIKEAVF